ncbi:MAG: molybdopterin cofactor-binding domain-containing protein [Aliidongia sp.]
MTIMMNRRTLLQASGSLVVTFALAPSLGLAGPAPVAKTVAPDAVDGYLAIAADGKVTVYSGKVDLGTGVRTALTQIVADELDVPLDHVTVIQGDTALTPDQGPSFGSLSIQNGGMQLRQAAATARRALLAEAATRLKADAAGLKLKDGVVTAPGGKSVAIGKLIGGKTLELKLDKAAPQKAPADYTLVGKPVRRLDIPDKVMARFTYMQNFKLPNMLHGRVIRPAGMGPLDPRVL